MTTPPLDHIIISIDGPAASGKGTVARGLALALGFEHLDSGLFYRAYPDIMEEIAGQSEDEISRLFAQRIFGDAVRLRDERHAQRAAAIAVDPKIRRTITSAIRVLGQRLLKKSPGLVVDGRDVGTVVFPDAEVKFYVTASVEARALRRWKEMQGRGDNATLAEIEADLRRRDERDRTRTEAPLRAAEDAIVMDTSDLGPEEAIAAAIAAVEARIARR